jgi:hypothetical protein
VRNGVLSPPPFLLLLLQCPSLVFSCYIEKKRIRAKLDLYSDQIKNSPFLSPFSFSFSSAFFSFPPLVDVVISGTVGELFNRGVCYVVGHAVEHDACPSLSLVENPLGGRGGRWGGIYCIDSFQPRIPLGLSRLSRLSP